MYTYAKNPVRLLWKRITSAIAIKKRNDNIAQRAESRRNKRLGIKDKGKDKGKGKGKGRGRPGFEGGKKGKKSAA